MPTEDPRDVRRLLGWLVVAGLSVAALTAMVALLTGSFSDMDWRVTGTSLAFAIYSALAAGGAAVMAAVHPHGQALGRVTAATAGLGFVLAVLLLWRVVDDGDVPVRSWGVVTIAAFTLSHAAIVLRARRPDDSSAVRTLASVSTALAALDGCIGALLVTGAVEIELAGFGTRLAAAAVVLLVATTLLPPILRRVGTTEPPARPSLDTFPRAVVEATDRIERFALPPEAREECRRLRQMARSLGG